MAATEAELNAAILAWRTARRLDEHGHKMQYRASTDPEKTGYYCPTCERAERVAACPHDGPRRWENPSNLPGDNRFVCSACGKWGLPEPVTCVP